MPTVHWSGRQECLPYIGMAGRNAYRTLEVAGRNAYRTLEWQAGMPTVHWAGNALMQAHGGRACFSETGDREAVFTRKVRRVLVLSGVGERSFVCWKPGYVTPLQGAAILNMAAPHRVEIAIGIEIE